ncbi:MAG: DUF6465 family protein [Oscillospiraceae bacterium]
MAQTKKTENKTTVEKTAVKADTKTAAKKPAAKKPAAKSAAKKSTSAEKKENVVVQFGGAEYNVSEVVDAARADFKANSKGCIRSLNVYIKPEDGAAYYVVNGKTEGKVDL